MAASKRNQKQIAERLKGNLDYYSRPHPFRTLRAWVSAATLIFGAGAVFAFYHFKAPEQFMNPGPISRGHTSIAQDCAACHIQAQLIQKDSHQVGALLGVEYYTPIDKSCQTCHQHFNFHEPNIVPDMTRPAGTGARDENSSCSACHREHLTAGKMLPTENKNCAACHDRADLMAASSAAGRQLPPRAFPTTRRPDGLLYFYKPRPREGYTQVFNAFDQGHPEFQIHVQHLKDPDTLQYNHARHERPDIPNTEKGKKLECSYCHKPDAGGMNFQPITFENQCAACHAMKFDPNAPGLVIPHGDPEKVRAFLRTLPNQYLEYAIQKNGANAQQAQAFMVDAVAKLAERYGGGPADYTQVGPRLEQQVFYSAEHVNTGAGALQRRLRDTNPGSASGGGALFSGCAFCHKVSAPVPNVTPKITKAVIFDRWLGDGTFNHAKHQQQTCAECHTSIHTSQLTSDINIPTQKSCTECHNSKPGGVANDCLSCHHYHNDPRTVTNNVQRPKTASTAQAGGLRAMLGEK